MTFAIIVFALTYVCLLAFPKYRDIIALISALIFIIAGVMPLSGIVSSVDFNVLLMIAGAMGLVAIFIDSKMPNLMADILLEKTPNVQMAIVAMAVFAGIISAFIDNVATVLMIAPVALSISKKLNINPTMMIIAIAVSSNLQGAATLVGDTTSILLGGAAKMDFSDFFWMNGRPGIFFAVEFGAIMSALILFFIFKKEKQAIPKCERIKVEDYVPSFLLCLMIILLILASFIPNKPEITNGLICFGLFIIGCIYTAVKNKSIKVFGNYMKQIDYKTILLLFGLFIVIGSIQNAGVIDAISSLFLKVGGDNLFLIYTIIVFASVICSAFIDNIPYVATMLPVVTSLALSLSVEPYVLYFGLLIGATLGGNLTPIGASANITAAGILRKEGYELKTSEFLKIGVPFTLTAVVSGYVFIWLMWGI